MEKVVFQNGVKKDQLLSAVNDYHGGVIVELKEPMDPYVFQNMLKASLSKWRLQGKKGVWIKLPIELVNLVETAVKEGFWYHHAEPHYLMLVYWIPETENTIPANASHRVGIGAIVLNDKRELLVIQENSGRLKGTAIWKIPTGIVEEEEDIFEGAIREVKEETGIDTEFMEVLAFRQTHKGFFGKSDLFFICMMRPLSFDIQKQDLEIEAAKWMPIEEYAALPFVQKHGLFKYIKDLCLVKADRSYPGFTPVPITSFFDASTSFLYCNKDCLDQESSASSSLKEESTGHINRDPKDPILLTKGRGTFSISPKPLLVNGGSIGGMMSSHASMLFSLDHIYDGIVEVDSDSTSLVLGLVRYGLWNKA